MGATIEEGDTVDIVDTVPVLVLICRMEIVVAFNRVVFVESCVIIDPCKDAKSPERNIMLDPVRTLGFMVWVNKDDVVIEDTLA